ncbi:hypothetical protein KC726_00905 [Candidatus Woesebacteria bacterium]|nr:hypothetical protein [Candidatus Woesebacteria bacterium]
MIPYFDLNLIFQGILVPEGSLQEAPYIGENPEAQFSIDLTLRKPINRPSNVVAYEGKWYYQAAHPTCTAWAVANVGLVLGKEPDMDSIWYLSQAAKHEDKTKEGLPIYKAVKYINQQDAMPYGFLGFNQVPSFKPYKYLPTAKFYIDEFDGQIKARMPFHNSKPPVDSIKAQPHENALLDSLDSGKPLIILVRSTDYSGSGRSHALCISGYRVDANGFTDFQVVDSARGIIWVPHERIMGARNEFSDYVAELK